MDPTDLSIGVGGSINPMRINQPNADQSTQCGSINPMRINQPNTDQSTQCGSIKPMRINQPTLSKRRQIMKVGKDISAQILIEALPYIQKFNNKIIVIK